MTRKTGIGRLLNVLRSRLDRAAIGYVVGGSFALGARGHVRATEDLDIMLFLPTGATLDHVHAALVPPLMAKSERVLHDDATGLDIDIYPVEDAAQQEAYATATSTTIEGVRVRVLSAEGVALMLLREATHGDQDRRLDRVVDLNWLARKNPTLDWHDIRDWARRMGWHQAYNDWAAPGKPPLRRP